LTDTQEWAIARTFANTLVERLEAQELEEALTERAENRDLARSRKLMAARTVRIALSIGAPPGALSALHVRQAMGELRAEFPEDYAAAVLNPTLADVA
jgi:hypothetical protein